MVAVPVEAVRLVPKVAGPEAKSVPIVAVPVEAVRLVPNVAGPEAKSVPMVAVLAERVPMVAVPVEAVRLVPNVAAPVKVLVLATEREEERVAAPVTESVEERVVAPAALRVPVDLTPALDSSSAVVVPSPSSMACNVPSIPPALTVLRSWP